MKNQKTNDALTESRFTAGLERKLPSLAEFIEAQAGFKLTSYQIKLVEAIERGEQVQIDMVTGRGPYYEWRRRYAEYFAL
jgi:hypothetical protein